MAKTTTKKAAAKAPKKAAVKPAAKTKKATSVSIDKTIEQALEKLISMDAAPQLQSDIKWCLGSYQYDKNPTGLYQTGAEALKVLSAARAKNSKSVPAKLIADLAKVLK